MPDFGKQWNSASRGWRRLTQPQNAQREPFKVLLLGQTGSGKTSFLNLLGNFEKILSGGQDAVFQFQKCNDAELENVEGGSMASKTNGARKYFVSIKGVNFEVIDTPGFGDSRGFEKDKEHVKSIVAEIEQEEHINAILLIMNGIAIKYADAKVNFSI